MLGFFLYVYASMALKAAYNNLFLLYVALFSACLYAFIIAFSTANQLISQQLINQLPRRAAAVFMFACGLVTLVVCLIPLLGSLIEGRAPDLLESYSTMVTDVLDLAIITPATFISGALILHRDSLGYRMLFPQQALSQWV